MSSSSVLRVSFAFEAVVAVGSVGMELVAALVVVAGRAAAPPVVSLSATSFGRDTSRRGFFGEIRFFVGMDGVLLGKCPIVAHLKISIWEGGSEGGGETEWKGRGKGKEKEKGEVQSKGGEGKGEMTGLSQSSL